jgi:hypothetical protein
LLDLLPGESKPNRIAEMLLATKLSSNLITSSKISQQNAVVAKCGFSTTTLGLIA